MLYSQTQCPTLPADMLGDLLAAVIEDRPVAATTREWIVTGILSAIRRDEPLDQALGLAGTGKTRLQAQLLMLQRDEHLCAALQLVALDESVSTWQRCQRLAPELRRFMCDTWPKTKRLSAPPDSWPAYKRALWHAACTDTKPPESASGLFKIASRNGAFSGKKTGGRLLANYL